MRQILQAVIRMGIFMICAQVLVHFRPKGSYEKYMKLLVSVMILAQIFFPVVNLFTGEQYDIRERVEEFVRELERTGESAAKAADEAQKQLKQMEYERMGYGQMDAEGVEDAELQKEAARQTEEQIPASVSRVERIQIGEGK